MSSPSTVVVTISRQMGSGGSFLGQAVARQLGFPYVDREILRRTAEELRVGEGELASVEEKVSSLWERFLAAAAAGGVKYAPGVTAATYDETVYQVEGRIIREIAGRTDAVIVGRAGFHILERHPGHVAVALRASRAWRISRVARLSGVSEDAAAAKIDASDRQRSEFIKAVTGSDWDDASRFDLFIDTSSAGIDLAVEFVVSLVSAKRKAIGLPAS